MQNFSSTIVRAVRKFHQIKQADFAPILETSQSALSKIEAGNLELSATQWLSLCDKFTLDPRSIFTGKIENLGERKLKLESINHVGGFDIPTQYSFLMGSSVRTAYPILKFMRLRLGEKRFESFLKSTGFDKDYFVIMNNPLNLKFIEHVVLFLLSEGCLSLNHVGSIIDLGQFKDIHSTLMMDFNHANDLDAATKKLLAKVKSSYELNTSYEFLGKKEYVVAQDHEFLADLKLSAEFNEFRKRYNLSHFEALDDFIINGENRFKMKSTQEGWLILKAS